MGGDGPRSLAVGLLEIAGGTSACRPAHHIRHQEQAHKGPCSLPGLSSFSLSRELDKFRIPVAGAWVLALLLISATPGLPLLALQLAVRPPNPDVRGAPPSDPSH